jgi:hypothetical protein
MHYKAPLTGKGYFMIERGLANLPLFKKEPYTEREAWIYLIEHAAYQPYICEIDGMAITLGMGELIASSRYLADQWGWAKDRANRFIQRLSRHGWIKTDTNYYVERDSSATVESKPYNKRPTLITICKYKELQHKNSCDDFAESDSYEGQSATALRQESDKPNQINSKNKNQKNNLVGRSNQDRFLFEVFTEVQNPEEFINYMPQDWQYYALYTKKWSMDEIIATATEFWIKYAGNTLRERITNQASLEKRKDWGAVWKSWCDQPFRNHSKDYD